MKVIYLDDDKIDAAPLTTSEVLAVSCYSRLLCDRFNRYPLKRDIRHGYLDIFVSLGRDDTSELSVVILDDEQENKYWELWAKASSKKGLTTSEQLGFYELSEKKFPSKSLKYRSTRKHEPGGRGTLMDLDSDTSQRVLENSIASGGQRYGFHNGKLYEFQFDNF